MLGRITVIAALCAAAALMALIAPERADSQSLVAATAAHRCSSLAALRHRSAGFRSLSSARIGKIERYCDATKPHIRKLRFWYAPWRRWTLYLNQPAKKCWQVRLRGPLSLCIRARAEVRRHVRELTWLNTRIKALMPAEASPAVGQDLAAAAGLRTCIAGVETPGSSHPYTQLNPTGKYKGRYQYDDGTWQTALDKAQTYYGVAISHAERADAATPWAQDVVTSFAVLHSGLLGWNPWAECR